jgi:predicted DNA-binding protein (UPF0251 family)
MTPLAGTTGQFQALDYFIAYGSFVEAAHRLGISDRTLKRRIERMRIANDLNTYQLVFRRGWETREEAA